MPGAARTYKNYMIKFPNEKVYVGYTSTSMEDRRKAHKRDMKLNRPVSNALKKYGFENVNWQIIAEFDNEHDALENEKKLIEEYNSRDINFGYNVSVGGETFPTGFNGSYWMEGKTEAEIKSINKKKGKPGETNPFYGKKHSKESMDKMVAKRRASGSYDIPSCSIPIIYDGIEYKTKSHMRRATGISRNKQNKLISEGIATLKAQINGKEVN